MIEDCGNIKVIKGLPYICNRDKAHKGDHMYLRDNMGDKEYEPVKRWKK